jgi:PPM family protein phosphatase
LNIVGRSDVGKVRTTNEDEIVFDPERGLAILADGMGGLEAGEIASSTAVQTILDTLTAVDRRDEALLRRAIKEANQQVLALSRKPQASAMGTTIVVWLDAGFGQCFVAHVGDSRVYRWRAGELRQITEDHSVVQQLVNEGVMSASEARISPQRNVITRAIGLEPAVEIDVGSWVLGPDDLFLLCSDGLSDMLTEHEIKALLARHLAAGAVADVARLQACADALVAAANEAGGLDNISVVLLQPD